MTNLTLEPICSEVFAKCPHFKGVTEVVLFALCHVPIHVKDPRLSCAGILGLSLTSLWDPLLLRHTPFPTPLQKRVPGTISKSYAVRRESFSSGRIQNSFTEKDILTSDQRANFHKRRWENGILMRNKMGTSASSPAFPYFAASLMSL